MRLAGSSATVVHAQTTSITDVESPAKAVLARDITVTVSVTYNKGYNGYYFGAAIFDYDTKTFATGSAKSSQNTCMQNAGEYSDSASCFYVPTSASGSDVITFMLRFYTAKTYSLNVFVLFEDASINGITDSESSRDFSITVTNNFALDVLTEPSVVVSVDGIAQAPGSVYLQLTPGSHMLSVPSVVQVNAGERLRFDHWSDGSTLTSRNLDLEGDLHFSLTYVTQYKLTLVTAHGSAVGDDWYDEGTTAKFSVPSSVLMNGILGSLGGRYDSMAGMKGRRSYPLQVIVHL